MSSCAIVGAGVSGLGAAWALREASFPVTVFEKSRGFSGRAATRGRQNVRYDHGANYFKTPTDRLRRLIQEQLPTEALTTIERDVWTFTADGTIHPGDREANATTKWTYANGISTLGKLLACKSTATVERQTRVGSVTPDDEQWVLHTTDGARLGRFESVLLTPPAPQTVDILCDLPIEADWHEAVLAALHDVSYVSQFSVILHFDRRLPLPDDYYALLNTDREHAVAWLGIENCKPGHVPEDQTVLVVQMAPHWTERHFEASTDRLVQAATRHAGALLDIDMGAPSWTDTQRWRYALPTDRIPPEALQAAERQGLFIAGDLRVGKGRVGRALASGLDVAAAIRSYTLSE